MEEQKQNQNKSEAETRKIHKIIIETAAVTLLVALVAGGIFWTWFKIKEGKDRVATLQDQIAEIEKTVPEKTGETTVSSGDSAAATAAVPVDDYPAEYKGWETYTNFEAGYKLRYPSTWQAREVSGTSQMFGKPVNYVVIYSPQKKYFLHWALRNAGDNFLMDERTGIGAGENVPDGHIAILGNEIDVNLFSYEGEAEEILYPSFGSVNIDGGKREIMANFSGGPKAEDDLKNVPERYIAEKILRSVRLVDRKTATCDPMLRPEDVEEMQNWNIFVNSQYGFSFRYPESWELSASNGKDYVSFEDNAFQFLSNQQVATADFKGYEEKSKTDFIEGCGNMTRKYLCGKPIKEPSSDPHEPCVITAQFEKNGVPHLITYSFSSLGASLSAIYTDTFNLVLKSVKFY